MDIVSAFDVPHTGHVMVDSVITWLSDIDVAQVQHREPKEHAHHRDAANGRMGAEPIGSASRCATLLPKEQESAQEAQSGRPFSCGAGVWEFVSALLRGAVLPDHFCVKRERILLRGL